MWSVYYHIRYMATKSEIRLVGEQLKKLGRLGPFVGITKDVVESAIEGYTAEMIVRRENRNVPVTSELINKMRKVVDTVNGLAEYISYDELHGAVEVLVYEVNRNISSEKAIIVALDCFLYRLKQGLVRNAVSMPRRMLNKIFQPHTLSLLRVQLQNFLLNHVKYMYSTSLSDAPDVGRRRETVKELLIAFVNKMPQGNAHLVARVLTLGAYQLYIDDQLGIELEKTNFQKSLRRSGFTDIKQSTKETFVVHLVNLVGSGCILDRVLRFAAGGFVNKTIVLVVMSKGAAVLFNFFSGPVWGACRRVVSRYVLRRPPPSSNVAQSVMNALEKKRKKRKAEDPPANDTLKPERKKKMKTTSKQTPPPVTPVVVRRTRSRSRAKT